MTLRVWVCPKCGIMRAKPGEPPNDGFYPFCDAHTEHWPDGEFTTAVTMQPTNFVVEVEVEQ
jgi:hypothetical protein